MHRILYFLYCVLLLQTASAQPSNKAFTFTGEIENIASGVLYLAYVDTNSHYLLDSCLLVNCKFSFKGYISSPQMATFYLDGFSTIGLRNPQFTLLFIEAGNMKGYFPKSDYKHSKIQGSASQETYRIYTNHLDTLAQNWQAAFAVYKKEKNEENVNTFQASQKEYELEKNRYTRQFIQQHPKSFVSGSLLEQEMLNLPYDTLKAYFNQLSTAVQNGVEGSIVKEYIRKHEAVAVGQQAPDFMQPDSSGAPVWLHDFKGQYVLLDFWASWCAPCRAEAPHLKQVYSRFKNKSFTIIGVSIDEEKNRAAWLNAIQKDSLYWPQLCDFTAWDNKVAKTYKALSDGIPSNFLINPQGTIIAAQLHGEALEKKLAEVLGSN